MKLRTKEETKQLSAEIVRCISENGELTGYGVVNRVKAPERTIRDHLERLTIRRVLTVEPRGKALVYRVNEEKIPLSKRRIEIRELKRLIDRAGDLL